MVKLTARVVCRPRPRLSGNLTRFKLQIRSDFIEQGRFSYTGLSHKDCGLIGQRGQEFLNRQDKIIANSLVDSLVVVDVFHIF